MIIFRDDRAAWSAAGPHEYGQQFAAEKVVQRRRAVHSAGQREVGGLLAKLDAIAADATGCDSFKLVHSPGQHAQCLQRAKDQEAEEQHRGAENDNGNQQGGVHWDHVELREGLTIGFRGGGQRDCRANHGAEAGHDRRSVRGQPVGSAEWGSNVPVSVLKAIAGSIWRATLWVGWVAWSDRHGQPITAKLHRAR